MRMIQIHNGRVGDIPLLVFEPRGGGPTVLVYHGLTASKDGQQKELQSLADCGFRAVGVDAVGHGERISLDLPSRLERDTATTLLDIVIRTVDEIPFLLDALGVGGVCGITGISMGAYVAFAAVVADARLRVAVPILGCPDWTVLAGEDPNRRRTLAPFLGRSPHRHLSAFADRALLCMNAGRDAHVPPHAARDFVRALHKRFDADAERYQYVEYSESEHFMREGDWSDLWHRTEAWLSRWLLQG